MIPAIGTPRTPASTTSGAADPIDEAGALDALFGPVDGGGATLERVDEALVDVTVSREAAAVVERVSRTVTAADIEAAFYLDELVRLASGLSLTETTVLLLRDGLAFLDLRTSPLELAVPDAPAEMAGWTRWRRTEDGGHELERRDDASWHAIDGVEIDRDASAAAILSGQYVRQSAYHLGGTSITRREGLVFGEGGELERRGDTLTTRGGVLSPSGDRLHASYTSWSSVDGLPRDADGRPLHDRFHLLDDGLTLEIVRADGSTERRLGYHLGDGFVLDGQAYARGVGPARLSAFGDAAARRVGGAGDWLALLAEAEEEERRREGEGALDPDVIAREAAAREPPRARTPSGRTPDAPLSASDAPATARSDG